MASHVIYFPDCPQCGREMKAFMDRKSDSSASPLGTYVEWWVCDNCDYTLKVDKTVRKVDGIDEDQS